MQIKPLLIESEKAHREGIVRYLKNGTAILKMPPNKEIRISSDHQFDLTQGTIFGLNERLTMSSTSPIVDKSGKTLRDEFNQEWELYTKCIEKAEGRYLDYGVYAYYPAKNDMVRYCSKYWHKIVSVASNSKLLTDPKGKLSWKEIRNVFDNTTVAVAGCSVGNSIINSIVMDIRPDNIKIADKSLYKMENINRVRLAYWDLVKSNLERQSVTDTLLRNKAIVTASQLYSVDPYINIHIYEEGIDSRNIKTFLEGSKKEPPADVVVEEVDDPKIKIFIREEARKRGIPVIMATDIGSSVQLDVLRYDIDKNLPLTYGTDDKTLIKSMNDVYEKAGDRSVFFGFVDMLIGKHYREGELQKIIEEKEEIPTSTIIPQLGSTVAMAGAITAEAVARLRLGHNLPARAIFNKHSFKAKTWE